MADHLRRLLGGSHAGKCDFPKMGLLRVFTDILTAPGKRFQALFRSFFLDANLRYAKFCRYQIFEKLKIFCLHQTSQSRKNQPHTTIYLAVFAKIHVFWALKQVFQNVQCTHICFSNKNFFTINEIIETLINT